MLSRFLYINWSSIDQLDKTEIPHVPDTYHLYLTIQSLNLLADNQVSFILPILQKVNDVRRSSQDLSASNSAESARHDEIMLAIDMVKSIGPSILAADTLLLFSYVDDEAFGLILKSFQQYTVVIGLLGLLSHRDAFLASLCKSCVPHGTPLSLDLGVVSKELVTFNLGSLVPANSLKPYTGSVVLNERNVMCLKALLFISDELQNVLENRAWYAILEIFQVADNLVSTGKVGKSGGESKDGTLPRNRASTITGSIAPPASSPGTLSQENHFSSISLHIKKFFEKTKGMPTKDLSEFTRALCQLAQETAIGASNIQAASASNQKDTIKVAEEKSFAVNKLLEVALGNINRLVNSPSSRHEEASKNNLPGVDIWDVIIGQLIEIAHTPASSVSIRAQACTAFGEILTSAIQIADLSNPSVELRIIEPIKDLILIEALSPIPTTEGTDDKDRAFRYTWLLEVQKSALETLNRILQAGGQHLSKGWLPIFEIIQGVVLSAKQKRVKAPETTSSELLNDGQPQSLTSPNTQQSSGKLAILVRLAFPSVQLICSDFLQLLTPFILSKCIETVSLFGSQTDDLNISLTAIRLLWSLSDFVLMKKLEIEKTPVEPVQAEPTSERTDDESEFMPLVDKNSELSSIRVSNQELFEGPATIRALGALWMFLLAHLSQLCSDGRPEVRNSANQSLFGTINLNGKKLTLDEWDEFIWNVLFPLLERIQASSEADIQAGTDKKISPSQSHYTRNTPSKQWDETKVLTLNGVSKSFIDYMHVLVELGPKFDDAWTRFLQYIQSACIWGSPEVAMASTKSFRALMQYPKNFSEGKTMPANVSLKILPLWMIGWKFWVDTGLEMILKCDEYLEVSVGTLLEAPLPVSQISHGVHSQETLVLFANLFHDIYDVVKAECTLDCFEKLFRVLVLFILYHPNPSTDPSARYRSLMANDLDQPTALQQSVLDTMIKLSDHLHTIPNGAELQIKFISNGVALPFLKSIHPSRKQGSNGLPSTNAEEKTFTYDAFSKKSIQLLEETLTRNVQSTTLYSSGAFETALDALALPLKIKYDSPIAFSKDLPPIWRYAVSSFMNIVRLSLDSLDSKVSGRIFIRLIASI